MPGTRAEGSWSSYAKALLATSFWGLSFIAVRIALESASPVGIVWMRGTLASVALFGLLRLRGLPLLPERADRGRCLVLGLVMGLHFLLQSVAMDLTTAMRAGWIIAFIPAVVAVGARVFLRGRLRAVGWLGIALASLGVFVLTSTRPAEFARAGLGDLLMLLSTFTWTAYTLLSIAPNRRSGGLRVAASALAISVVPNLVAALCAGTWHGVPAARSIAALAFLGLGASALAMWVFNDALAELGPERSSAFQYLQPFVTVVGSLALLGEPVTTGPLLGGPLVLLGVWLVQRGKR